ncbi:hypothetical protein FACS189465_2010 [Clostridia bacterium]|nr:hypothetical protein FACS189465_2010 [Clostridia bacterium]
MVWYSTSVSSSQKITENGITLFSKTMDISHNSDGSKTLTSSAWISLDTPLTSSEQSYSQGLSTIPRNAICTGADDFNSDGNPKIYFTNPGNFDLQLKMEAGGNTALITRDKPTKTSPYTFSLTTAERNLLFGKTPNSNSLSVRFTIGTYRNGSIEYWSYVDRTMTVVNSYPTFSDSNITYQDTNSTVTAITGNNQWIVRNQSNLKVTFTSATAKNSATMSSYQLTFNGATQTKTAASTIDYGTVNSSSSLSATVKAIDSIGNYTSVSKTVTIYDWQNPTAVVSLARVNNYESSTRLKVNASISSVNSKNSLQSIQYRYRQNGTSSWSSYTVISNNTQYTTTRDNTLAWDFQFVVTDKFGSTTYSMTLAKGIPIMFFDTNKISVGVNRYPSNSGTFETNDIYSNGVKIVANPYPVGSIYLSVNSTNPSTYFGGTWVAWGSGRVPVGVNTSGTFNTVEKTGGSETVTLTTSQIPSHSHGLARAPAGSAYRESYGYTTTASRDQTTYTDSTGDGGSHSNLQPYITCYMWKRTA